MSWILSTKDNQIILECLKCNKKYEKDGDINKCILLLRKGNYSYEHNDNWERFNET